MTPPDATAVPATASPPIAGSHAPGAEVRPSRPGDDEARDAFVRAHPRASFFHQAGWGRVVERVLGHERCDWIAVDGGRVTGVLPLMRAPRLVTRGALISLPYAVYGGAVGESAAIEQALVRAAIAQAERESAGRLELRCVDDPGLDLARSDLYATFVETLPFSVDAVLSGMPKKARAEARKAREKHGLRLREGIWYLDDLFRLFQRNKRALGSPGLPHRFFWWLHKEFGDAVRVHVVHRGSEPVAAVMSFVWRNEVAAYYSGTAEGADRSWSASNFMYMALREWSVEHGFRRFDFGRSRKGSGAFAFKEHQGFVPRDLNYRFHLVRDRHLPALTPSNPRTKILRDTWARLPLALTTRLSTPLARYLP
jgi:FemAB-related protein (PEP-CTERM system-associated)